MEPEQPLEVNATEKTLLIVFIHGFKGNDDTFGSFPTYLASLVAEALPTHKVSTLVYPAYDTRGELRNCVSDFREWLVNKVIDLEVEKGTSSPTINPNVHVMLAGHSMGGIMAAETLLGIIWDGLEGTDAEKPSLDSKDASLGGLVLERLENQRGLCMFPYIRGVLSFDTPYLGIAPGVVAHAAEGQWQTGKAWLEGASGLMAAMAASSGVGAANKQDRTRDEPKSLPPTETQQSSKPSKSGWGKYAAIAGAASVVAAAGGATAYFKKEEISSGFTWASSHLEFVGTLARPEDLKKRLNAVKKIGEVYKVGFANLYTSLESRSEEKWSSKALGSDRTFCNIPKSDLSQFFYRQLNKSATSETWAHIEMFVPKDNPGYYAMGELARDLVCQWESRA